jgi:hypothetical protein
MKMRGMGFLKSYGFAGRETADESFAYLGLGHLEEPTTDRRLIETFGKVETPDYWRNASFLIQTADGTAFFAERGIFIAESVFFRVG